MDNRLDNRVYYTRPNKEKAATEDEIIRFEKFVLADIHRGKQFFIIEEFPIKFFGYATKIRLQKVMEPVGTLSEESNGRLYKVVSTSSIYE